MAEGITIRMGMFADAMLGLMKKKPAKEPAEEPKR